MILRLGEYAGSLPGHATVHFSKESSKSLGTPEFLVNDLNNSQDNIHLRNCLLSICKRSIALAIYKLSSKLHIHHSKVYLIIKQKEQETKNWPNY